MVCSTASDTCASSVAEAAGRKPGTVAPASFAISATSGSSVETHTSVTHAAARAARMVWTINGKSPSTRLFLPGSPFDPPRAGMTARTVTGKPPVKERRSCSRAGTFHDFDEPAFLVGLDLFTVLVLFTGLVLGEPRDLLGNEDRLIVVLLPPPLVFV